MKKTLKTYQVKYTNKKGKRISRNVKAYNGDNAYLYIKRTIGGKNISVNKLG